MQLPILLVSNITTSKDELQKCDNLLWVTAISAKTSTNAIHDHPVTWRMGPNVWDFY